MKPFIPIISIVAFAVAGATACDRGKTQKVETEIETETDAATGETVKTEAEAAGRVPGGAEIDAEQETYVGVVKEYDAGKRLKLETANGETHSFDLDSRAAQVTVQPSVKVGAKVEVIIDEQKDQPKKISVIPLG